MVSVIFPAAGQGKRMQAGMNKVFMSLGDVPILVRTLIKFSQCEAVDQLVIVVAPYETELVRNFLGKIPNLKPWQVVAGGTERQYSVMNGIMATPADSQIILVHDAARPLVSNDTILEVINKAQTQGAAIAAVPAKNTIKVCEYGKVTDTPDRNLLWEVQTPQGFQRELLLKAYRQAVNTNFLGTDDASLVEKAGYPVYLVKSDYANIKITTPEDIVIAEALIQAEGEWPSIQAVYQEKSPRFFANMSKKIFNELQEKEDKS